MTTTIPEPGDIKIVAFDLDDTLAESKSAVKPEMARAAVADKHAWDPGSVKRNALREAVAADVPQLEVRAGGSTSIDITMKGIDKAHGMRALEQQTGIPQANMLFVGDRLQPGGNDYPVLEMGIACQAVEGPQETLELVRDLVDRFRQA